MFTRRVSYMLHLTFLLVTITYTSSFAQMAYSRFGYVKTTKQQLAGSPFIEKLGKHLFCDNIASPDNMSCATCHGQNAGFTGPKSAINKSGSVYPGAVAERFGNRKPPSAAYATYSPVFHYDQQQGSFVGGNFWDGRATGEHLGNPAADQALGPFLNPVEQNNASKVAVLNQIAQAPYAFLWTKVFGVPLTFDTPEEIDANYDKVGLAIAAFEKSDLVSPFTSKYDYYLKGEATLSDAELAGLQLFNGMGKCADCHSSTIGPYCDKPLFTNFSYDNLGVPKNPENPFYRMADVYLGDEPINPLGKDWIDYGLGGYLSTTEDWADYASANNGKFKVPTLRNVDKRPSSHFVKAYCHNGVFKSLKEIVHFYNTRDIEDWPLPEVSQNMNTVEIGNLGLTDNEEDAIVLFLETLSDGYIP